MLKVPLQSINVALTSRHVAVLALGKLFFLFFRWLRFVYAAAKKETKNALDTRGCAFCGTTEHERGFTRTTHSTQKKLKSL